MSRLTLALLATAAAALLPSASWAQSTPAETVNATEPAPPHPSTSAAPKALPPAGPVTNPGPAPKLVEPGEPIKIPGTAGIPDVPPAALEPPAAAVIETDLWERVRHGFGLAALDSPLIRKHEQWYASRQDYIQRFVERGSRYLYHVVEEVERRGMPTEIVLLPIIESAFNPQAYSRAQASGMWQFIPSTGRLYGLQQDWSADHRRDVILSTNAALDYLQKLYAQFNSWELAFAAYNCGEGCVARAILKNERKKKPTDFVHLNLPRETQNYVPKLMAVKNIIMTPGDFGILLASVTNRPYFTKVDAPERIDVNLAAKLAEMPQDEFCALNPAFTKPVASSASGYFLVPVENAETFRANLEQYRSLNGPLVSWQAVSVKRGESVDKVAQRYGMTPSYLRATNGPFKERKGKFTQPVTLMAPIAKEAEIIRATLDRKSTMGNPARNTLAGNLPSFEPNTDAPSLAPVQPQLARAALSVPPATPASLPAEKEQPAAALATNKPSAPAATIPASYTVQPGDTLFSIAKRFDLTVAQVQSTNHLRSTTISAGQRLTLNGGAPTATGTVAVAARTKQAPVMYVIEDGDTLSDIADKYGVRLSDLLRWNNLTTRSIINPGKKLRVSG